VSRRGFIRSTTVAAVGSAGLLASSGAASAASGFPRVSTRGHFDDDADLASGESRYSYDVAGDWSGYDGGELALFVHGWRNGPSDAIAGAEAYRNALEANGFDGFTALFTWDSDMGDSVDLGWSDAKDIADGNGPKLAKFVVDGRAGGPVRPIGHSLGARVMIRTCESVERDFGAANAIDSGALIGGAVQDDDVSLDAGWWDAEYGDHIEYACGQFDNYYNDGDGVLNWIYATREWDTAVGAEGIEGPAPANYEDHDVSDQVSGHSDYYKPDVGCVPQIVAEW
jgi:hypothetical protein